MAYRGGGSKKGERRGGGSRRGIPNARTMAVVKRAEADLRDAQDRVTRLQQRLPKDILFEYANVLAGMAAYYQPTPPGTPEQNANADDAKFEKYANLTLAFAKAAAPFFSPQYTRVAVSMSGEQTITKDTPLLDIDANGKVTRIGGITEATRIYQQMCKIGRPQS